MCGKLLRAGCESRVVQVWAVRAARRLGWSEEAAATARWAAQRAGAWSSEVEVAQKCYRQLKIHSALAMSSSGMVMRACSVTLGTCRELRPL